MNRTSEWSNLERYSKLLFPIASIYNPQTNTCNIHKFQHFHTRTPITTKHSIRWVPSKLFDNIINLKIHVIQTSNSRIQKC
jgi:hypothetical protein